METSQPQQISVSGRIVVEGQLPPPSSATLETAPTPPSQPQPWWKFWKRPPEIVLAIATVILAVATIILAVIAAIQAYILATTDASTRKVADAAQSAAGTAKATLEASERSFRQEQRPYLWATSFNLADTPVCQIPGGTGICADVHIVNSGRTPAIGVHIHHYATFGANAESVIKAMKVPPYPSPTGDMLGSVGQKWVTAATDVVDEATAKDILDGKISIYVYGVVQYFDIFGEYHETGFCSYRLPNNGPFITCGEFGHWFDKR
jgi:hypothetical protein